MNNEKPLIKIICTFLVIGFVIWFGGTLMRQAIAYQLFDTSDELVLKQNLTDTEKMQTVRLFTTLAGYTGGAYLIAYLSGLFIFIKKRKILKEQGWLFMSLILFLATGFIEFYLLYYDYQLAMGVFYEPYMKFGDFPVQQFFYSRIKNLTLSTMSGLTSLSGLTSIIFVIWMPLKKSEELTVQNEN